MLLLEAVLTSDCVHVSRRREVRQPDPGSGACLTRGIAEEPRRVTSMLQFGISICLSKAAERSGLGRILG